MAAPVWQSATTVTSGNGTSCIYTLPASIAVNDIVVLVLYKENTAAVTPPAGFAEKTSVATGVGVHQQVILWKRMAGGESGTVTASWTGNVFRAGQAHRISGCQTSGDPWNTDITTNFNNVNAVVTPAVSLATTPTDSLLFWGATDFAGSTTVWTPPTGFTNRGGTGASTDVMQVATKDNTAGGATGSLTGSVDIGNDTMTAFLGALSSGVAAELGGPWFTSPLAEMPYAEKQAPWEYRPNQPPIPMQVWASPPAPVGDQSIALSDTVAADDTLTVAAAVPLADTAAASDALTVAAATPLTDTAAAADALVVAAGVPLSDTAVADDALSITTALSLAETATAVDALVVSAAIPLSDTAAADDQLAVSVPITLTDTAAAADALSVATAVPLADTATTVDALAVAAATTLTDTATADDSLSVLSDTSPPLGAPFLSPFAELPFAAPAPWEGGLNKGVIVLEVWTSPPAPSGDQSISLADTASASDSLAITAISLPLADTASATDALAVTVALALADTATAVETLTAGVPITLSDTAAAVDALSVQETGSAKTLTDTASATDSLVITVALALADTASAVDAISIPEAPQQAIVSRISTGHQMSRASTATDARRVTTGAQMSRASSGTDARRVSTGHQMSRISAI